MAVTLEDGLFSGSMVSPTIQEIYENLGPAECLAVDIPIGLPDDGEHYPRPSDVEAEDLCSRHNNIIEAHPEVSFPVMKGAPLEFSKKNWNGQNEQRRLLDLEGIQIPDALPGKPGHAPPNDILDGAAAAWTAHRFALGQAKSLPAQRVESSGRIWY